MRGRRVLFTLAAAAVVTAMALPAQAVRFRADFFGRIDFADGGNGFGLAAGNLVRGFAIYDDAALSTAPITGTVSGDFQRVAAGNGSTFTLDLFIGNQTFTESHEIDFLTGLFPEFYFLDGRFAGFDFVADPDQTGDFEFESFAADYRSTFANDAGNPFTGRLFFAGMDPLGGNIEGFFNFPARVVRPVDDNDNPVPEPGTLLLVGSGLLGLAGYGRKRRQG